MSSLRFLLLAVAIAAVGWLVIHWLGQYFFTVLLVLTVGPLLWQVRKDRKEREAREEKTEGKDPPP